MFESRFEVSRINSMQWNRTMNGEIFSFLDDPAVTKKPIPPDVLEKVKQLLQRELAPLATKELADAGRSKNVIVEVDIKSE